MEGISQSKTYSTGQIAKIAGVHPNTVRMYEEWGLIHRPLRRPNGYRVFNETHVKQLELVKKALRIPVLQSGLRKMILAAVTLSADYRFEEAEMMIDEYIRTAEQEILNAQEAAKLSESLYREVSGPGREYKRAQAAKELGLTIDTIRNWEMNGLITVKRRENGYRVYDEADMNRLRIIRSLRSASYSLSAILRMLNRLRPDQHKAGEIYHFLNTPDENESIVSVCDRLVSSLRSAIQNAREAKEIIREMNQMNMTNPPL